MNLNKVFLIGNLTRDPELRQTPSGQAVCTLGLATNRRYKDNLGQLQEQTEFHQVVAWGRNAEIVNQYLRKGSSVLIEGRLQTHSWQDQQGQKRWRTEVIAERIQLGPKPTGGSMGTRDNFPAAPTGAEAHPPSASGGGRPPPAEELPVVELPRDEEEEIDPKDIPF